MVLPFMRPPVLVPAMRAGVRRDLADKFISKAANLGLGANATLRQLEAGGLGVRRTYGLKRYREFRGVTEARSSLQSVRHDYLPSKAIIKDIGYRQSYNYRYDVNVDVLNTNTGETFTMKKTVGSDIPLTPGQIEADAMDATSDDVDKSPAQILRMVPMSAIHKQGAEW